MRMLLWFRKEKFKTLALELLEQKRLRGEVGNRPTNTYASAKARLDRLILHFGHTALSEITEADWATYVVNRLKKRPGSKFFDDRKYMRQVMLEAQRRRLVLQTPRLKIPDLPTIVGREITPPEVRRLFQNASPELRFQIDIASLMGLRLREMLYLRWDQIDWARQTIHLLPSDTKTRRAREVPINPDLIPRFRKRYMQRKSRYVFPRKTDLTRPTHHNRWEWKACKRKAGVSARWHDWRHTAATKMLRRGNSVQAVRTYLGMSEAVLTRIYQHLNIDDLRLVARRMSQKGK